MSKIGAMGTIPERRAAMGAAADGAAQSTRAFAAIGDHARLPWRFFARLCASDGSLLR
jgi:hypothetical protein